MSKSHLRPNYLIWCGEAFVSFIREFRELTPITASWSRGALVLALEVSH